MFFVVVSRPSTVDCVISVCLILTIIANGSTTVSDQGTTSEYIIMLLLTFSSSVLRLFIVTLVSALLGVVLMVIVCLTLFVTFFAARDQLRYFCDVPGNATACDPTLRILAIAVPDPVFPTVVAILGPPSCGRNWSDWSPHHLSLLSQ